VTVHERRTTPVAVAIAIPLKRLQLADALSQHRVEPTDDLRVGLGALHDGVQIVFELACKVGVNHLGQVRGQVRRDLRTQGRYQVPVFELLGKVRVEQLLGPLGHWMLHFDAHRLVLGR
jgi:hypothetical protein